MKKFSKLIFAAAVILALASCRKDFDLPSNGIPSENHVLLTINAGAPQTDGTPQASAPVSRTGISGTTPSWKSGDKVTVVYTNTSSEVVTAQSSALASNTTEATFSATLTNPDLQQPAHAYYPANSRLATASSATLVIPARQRPTGTSFDGAADILVSKGFTPSGSIETQFRRLGAVLKIKLSNAVIGSDNIEKVVVTAEVPLAGEVAVRLEDGVTTGISNISDKVVADYTAGGQFTMASDNYVYLVVYPQTLAAGTHLFVEGETANATFYKDIILPADIELKPGHIQPLNISVNNVNRTFFKETFGGEDSSLDTGTGALSTDETGWSFTKEYAAGSGGHSVRLGTSSVKGVATTPSITVPSGFRGQTLTLSFKAAAWNGGSEQTQLAVSVTGTGTSLSGAALSSGKVTTVKGSWTDYELNIGTTASTSSFTVKFQGIQDDNARFFLDDVFIYCGDLDYEINDGVPEVPVNPQPVDPSAPLQYLRCYEMPEFDLVNDETYTSRGTETFGDTYWYEYDTNDATRKVVTHTYEYNSTLYRNYTAIVDKDYRCPVLTAYAMHATAYPNNDVKRGDFSTSTSYDPAIPRSWQSSGSTYDYNNGAGYARGHHCASEDRQTCRDANDQTFYYTNQSPQIQNSFNGGIWASLEGAVQSHAPTGRDTLYVVVGTLFDPLNMDKSNDSGKVGRPSHFYKCLMKCTFDGSGNMTAARGVAYLFENRAYTGNYNDAANRKTIDYIESLCGFNLFANVPTALQNAAETTNASLW